MGNLIVKIGKEREGEIVRKFGLGSRNEHGKKWVLLCTANDHIITNTFHVSRSAQGACGHEEARKETQKAILII